MIFGLLTPDEIHGPYVAQRHIGPINGPYKNDNNLARPTSGLLKARVLGRRIYGPPEFQHVKVQWVIWHNQGPISLSIFSRPMFLWARDIYTCKWPIFTEGPNYV